MAVLAIECRQLATSTGRKFSGFLHTSSVELLQSALKVMTVPLIAWTRTGCPVQAADGGRFAGPWTGRLPDRY